MPTVPPQHRQPPTPRQSDVLAFIAAYRHRHGYAPAMREIADKLGISKVSIFEHVNELVRKGHLRRDPHKARSLDVVGGVPAVKSRLRFPILGTIARNGVYIEGL